jgi:polyisoprenoid-binding protein YceI
MKFLHKAVATGVAMLMLSTAWAAPEAFTIDPAHTYPMLKKLNCGAEVSADIKRSDFGMLAGISAVGDDIRLTLPVEALKD